MKLNRIRFAIIGLAALGLCSCASTPLNLKKPLSKQARIGVVSELGDPGFISSDLHHTKNESALKKFLVQTGSLNSFSCPIPNYNIDKEIAQSIANQIKKAGYQHVTIIDGKKNMNVSISKYHLDDVIAIMGDSASAPDEDGNVTAFDPYYGGIELTDYGVYYSSKGMFAGAYTSGFAIYDASVFEAGDLQSPIAGEVFMQGKAFQTAAYPKNAQSVTKAQFNELKNWLNSEVVPSATNNAMIVMGLKKAPHHSWF